MFSVITFRNSFVKQTMPIHFGQVGLRRALGGGEGGVDPRRRAIFHTKTLLHMWKSHWCSGWPYMETHLIVNNFMMLTSNSFCQEPKN